MVRCADIKKNHIHTNYTLLIECDLHDTRMCIYMYILYNIILYVYTIVNSTIYIARQ